MTEQKKDWGQINVAASRIARESIKQHEGFVDVAYKCPAGYLTIGYGRNIDSKGGKGLTLTEAEMLLENDINENFAAASSYDWFYSLNAVRRAVVVEMIFNLGLFGFSKFKKTIAAIEAEDYDAAASEMLQSKWATQVGKRAKRLSERMRAGRID